MRILFVASLHHPPQEGLEYDSHPSSFPLSQAQHFWVKALERRGHVCTVFWRSASTFALLRSPPLYMSSRLSPRRALGALAASLPALNPDYRLRNRSLIQFASRFEPDVILLIGGNKVILPGTLAELKQRHAAVLIYTCGTSPRVFSHRIERAAADLYDLVIANDLYHAQEWQAMGAPRAEVLPMSAVDPEFHRPSDLDAERQSRYACEIAFVGTLVPEKFYGHRIAALEAVRSFNLGIWSVHEVPPSLRASYRGPALGKSMMHALSGAAIAINPLGDFMRYGGNMRLFEACGAGTLQITNACPAVNVWFQPGTHLVTYRRVEELNGLSTAYLARADERRRIATAGRAHVYAHHTYDQRMARLIELIDQLHPT